MTSVLESCAACGKTDVNLKSCGSCMLVKYCNVDCQTAHRPAHKKSCKKRAAELFDEKLFAMPSPREDCPICCIILPPAYETTFKPCCGKFICNGCRYCLTRDVCPFCNTPNYDGNEDYKAMLSKRINRFNDPAALFMLGCHYNEGSCGISVDQPKAIESWCRASELGCAVAHYRLGIAYVDGDGVDMDKKKAVHHWQIAAMKGIEQARYNLGGIEYNSGNDDRAMKHFMISAKCGYDKSLQEIKKGFMEGKVTKDDFESVLRAHKASQDERKSYQRESAKKIRWV